MNIWVEALILVLAVSLVWLALELAFAENEPHGWEGVTDRGEYHWDADVKHGREEE